MDAVCRTGRGPPDEVDLPAAAVCRTGLELDPVLAVGVDDQRRRRVVRRQQVGVCNENGGLEFSIELLY